MSEKRRESCCPCAVACLSDTNAPNPPGDNWFVYRLFVYRLLDATCSCAQWATNDKCQDRLVQLVQGETKPDSRRALLESGHEPKGRRLCDSSMCAATVPIPNARCSFCPIVKQRCLPIISTQCQCHLSARSPCLTSHSRVSAVRRQPCIDRARACIRRAPIGGTCGCTRTQARCVQRIGCDMNEFRRRCNAATGCPCRP